MQKVYHFKSDPNVLNIYYVLNRILFREEENLNRLLSSEIKQMAGNSLISPRIQILESPFSSQLWVILELYFIYIYKIFCIEEYDYQIN